MGVHAPGAELRARLVGYLSLVALLTVSCWGGRDEDRALARVGDWTLTVGDFGAELKQHQESGRADTASYRRALLDDRVLRAVLAENARGAGYDERPEVRMQLERLMIGQFVEDQMKERLAGLEVRPAEVEAYYQSQLDRYTTPERVRVAAILIPVPAGASDETRAARREKAETALAAAQKQSADSDGGGPRSFGPLSVRFSEDQATRYVGGDLGWLDRDSAGGDWNPELVEAALALAEAGALTPLLVTPEGFAIAKLMERRPRTTQPLADVAEGIRKRLLAAKRDHAHQEFLAEMRAAVRIELDEEVFAALPAPAAEARQVPIPRPPPLPGG